MSNIAYNITGGNVHIDNRIFVVERDFSRSILFLSIDKATPGYEAMLSVKSEDDTSLSLFRETVQLSISDDLFNQVNQFQSIRRSVDDSLRFVGHANRSSESWETMLTDALHQTFFQDDIGSACRDFLDLLQTGKISELLLVISSEDERIQNLPWEMVLPKLTPGTYDLPRNNFGLIRSREKSLQRFNRQGPTVEMAPLKMLFIPALPENMNERNKLLEIEDEQRKIIKAVRQLEATGDQQPKLVMEILDCANLEEIKEALHNRSHDIVHISGHGAYVEAVKEGMLYLENEDGDEKETSGHQLGVALREFSSIKLLVLSACETAVGGSVGSTAEQLAAVGLPAVLAMRFAVTDVAARLFTEKFYERLTAGDTLTKAMHDARQKLWQHTQQQRANAPKVFTPAEWFTPVLYQNQLIGSLVKPGQYNSTTLHRFYPKSAFLRGAHTRLIGEGFIGRKRLLIRLRQCFQQGQHVCLHGLGGLGKTTTAEAFADSYRKRYGHDILVFRNGTEIQEAVILNQIFEKWKITTQPDEYVAQQLKAKLDSPENTSEAKLKSEAKLQFLIDNCLDGHSIILLFDNFEDVQTDQNNTQQQAIVSKSLRDFMRYLLQQAPHSCHILFTSRYRITDFTDLVTDLAVDKMTYAEQYRYINFSATLRKIPVSERTIIDRRFDGHPRALQFLEGLLSKDRNFDLGRLDASMGEVETRIFENLLLKRIYDRLSETERAIFSTASIFFSRSPLAALCAITAREADELIPVLLALRDWSLCFWDEQKQVFEVHALTRAWMRQQEQSNHELLATLSQRAGVFFREQPTWDDKLLAKAYFEQAEAWEDYAEAAFNLAGRYRLIGLYLVARDLAEKVLTRNISPFSNARALNTLGLIDSSVGAYEQAFRFLEQSLKISQQIGDKSGEGTTLNNISQIYQAQGNYEQTLTYLERSLSIRQQIGDKRGEGTNLNNMGQIYEAQGDYKQALIYLERSLNIYQQIGDKSGDGAILNNIGQIYLAQGDYKKALIYLERSLSIQQQIGDKSGEGTTLNNISQIYQAQGDYEQTLAYLERSLSIRQQIGDKRGEGTTINNIGRIYQAQGDYERALTHLEQSLNIQQQIGDKRGEGTSLNNISLIYSAQGDYERALTYLEQSLNIQQQIGDKRGEGTTLNNISHIYDIQGDYRRSLSYLEQSLTIRQQIGGKSGMAATMNNLGAIYFKQYQNLEKARPLLMQSYIILSQIGSPNAKAPEGYLEIIFEQVGEERFIQLIQGGQNDEPV